MKTTKSLVAILTLTLALAAQAQAQSFLTNGLVAYYPFNGNAKDASANGNDLTSYGATLCADRFGNANQAYYFNGSTYLASSISPLTQIDDWTVTAWIRPGTLPQAAAYAVCVGYANGTTGDGYALGIDGLSTGFGGEPGNNVFAALSGVNFTSFGYQFSSTNGWHQVVMLRSAGTLAIYVDGNPTTNVNSNPSLTPIAPTSIAIGSGGTGGVYSFVGAVDDVRIYNLVLSSNEVEQLYQYESAGPCTVPYPATATATVVDGFVVSATVTDGGCGYTNTPLVQIVGGGGSGATATAIVTNGVVVGITITDAGIGYTSAPTVYVYSPLGVQIGMLQAVIPTFSSLSIGSNYQLQASLDLSTWTNEGSVFTATNATMIYPQYFNVAGWGQLYFRLQAAP